MAVADGVPVAALAAADERDTRGVNDRAQLVALERIVQRRTADALLVAGTWIADPDRFDLRGTLECGRDVRIDVGCVFEGDVRLADGVEIGAHCVLRDVAIGAGTVIFPFSHLTSAAIGARCQVGPFARLRPGAELARAGARRQLRRDQGLGDRRARARPTTSATSATPPSAATSTSAPAPSSATTTARTSTGP